MARTTPRIVPPFSWLGRFTTVVGLGGTVAIAALFRFWHLDLLPPGLGDRVASTGLEALKLVEHGTLPGLSAANNYAPAWVVLQSLAVKMFGNTALALRYWPALLGILAVATTWLWLQSWFGRRVAWVGALVMAVIPWTVTMSRSGSEAAAAPLLVSLSFWLATLVWRRGTPATIAGLTLTLIVDLFFGPLGWMTVATMLVLGINQVIHERRSKLFTKARVIGGVLSAAGLTTFAVVAANSAGQLQQLPAAAHVVTGIGTLCSNAAAVFLMVFAPNAGDINYQHNVAGEPVLNAFLGLMFIAGIIVSISRLQLRRYRWALGALALLVIPGIITSIGVPNSARIYAAAPAVAALCGIGTSYLLELWYATFPINSAARSAGQAAVLVLLGLTVYLSYTQYFRAWGQMSETYAAAGDGAAHMATNLKTDKFIGQRFVVFPVGRREVIAYLSHGGPTYTALNPADITTLPTTPVGGRQFWLSPETRDDAMKLIKAKFPGGVLRPHYSPFNQTEIYYTYEVTSK